MTNKNTINKNKNLSVLGILCLSIFFIYNLVSAAISSPSDIQERLDEVKRETQQQLNQTKIETLILSGRVIIENTIETQKRLITTSAKTRFKELATIQNTNQLDIYTKSKRNETDAKIQKSRLQFEEDIKNKDLNTANVLDQKNKETLELAKERQRIFDMDSSFRKEEMEARLIGVQKELQNNLLKIVDEEKRTKVYEIATDFQSVNRKAMDKFAKDVEKIDLTFSNLELQADKLIVGGQSVQNLRSLLDNAGNSIENARTAIASQYGKVYSVKIKNEESLKPEMMNVRDVLQADINSVGVKVQIASSSVSALADTIQKVPDTSTSVVDKAVNNSNLPKAQ